MSEKVDWETEIIYRGRPLSDYRAAVFEETKERCARELETYHRRNMMWGEDNGWFVDAAAAIRALKDKT